MSHWQLHHNKYGLRSFYSVLIACGLTLFLFTVMQFLTSGNNSGFLQIPTGSSLQFIRIKTESTTELKQRELPKKPQPPKQISPKSFSTKNKLSPQSVARPSMDVPGIPAISLNNRPFLGGFNNMSMDSNLMPLVRVEPNYPRNAARRGIEGWVEIEFVVLKDGTVSNAKVIKSNPKRIFDREAIHAIRRWKFKPKIIDGKPVKQNATQTIRFKLAKP